MRKPDIDLLCEHVPRYPQLQESRFIAVDCLFENLGSNGAALLIEAVQDDTQHKTKSAEHIGYRESLRSSFGGIGAITIKDKSSYRNRVMNAVFYLHTDSESDVPAEMIEGLGYACLCSDDLGNISGIWIHPTLSVDTQFRIFEKIISLDGFNTGSSGVAFLDWAAVFTGDGWREDLMVLVDGFHDGLRGRIRKAMDKGKYQLNTSDVFEQNFGVRVVLELPKNRGTRNLLVTDYPESELLAIRKLKFYRCWG